MRRRRLLAVAAVGGGLTTIGLRLLGSKKCSYQLEASSHIALTTLRKHLPNSTHCNVRSFGTANTLLVNNILVPNQEFQTFNMIYKPQEWLTKQELMAQVVIVGSGAAGLTLAMKLGRLGVRSIVLEAGLDRYTAASHDAYRGTMTGKYQLANGLAGLRQRFLGGSTNCWAGGCAQFEDEDFASRDWIPLSGWPLSKHQLQAFYGEAAEFLSVNYSAIKNPVEQKAAPELTGFETRSLQYCENLRFKDVFSQELQNSTKIEICLGATVTALSCSNNTANAVTVTSPDGKSKIINGKIFVMATGGLENARLLLNFQRQAPGIHFLENKNIGKYFQEHLIAPFGTLVGNDGNILSSPLEAWQYTSKGYTPFFKAPFSVQKKYETLNFSVQLTSQEGEFSAADASALKIYKRFKGISSTDITLGDFTRTLLSPVDVAGTFLAKKTSSAQRIALRIQMEQAPNPQSVVSITDDTDQFGLHRIDLSWNFTELERRTVETALGYTAECLWGEQIGTLKVDAGALEDQFLLPRDIRGGGHHSGTTRMGTSAADAVVDSNQKVFHSTIFTLRAHPYFRRTVGLIPLLLL